MEVPRWPPLRVGVDYITNLLTQVVLTTVSVAECRRPCLSALGVCVRSDACRRLLRTRCCRGRNAPPRQKSSKLLAISEKMARFAQFWLGLKSLRSGFK